MLKLIVFSTLAIAIFLLESFRVNFHNETISKSDFKTEHIIVCVIDGPRYTETFGDSSCKYIPKMGKEMTKSGVLYTDFKNNGPTYTSSGHTAITTGFYQSLNNGGKDLPKKPSFFQYYLKAKQADKTDAYIVSSKGKLEILANTKDKKWWNMYMPSSYCGPNGNSSSYVSDIQTVEKVNELLDSKPPKLMLINLLAVDSYGHANDWDAYLLSLQRCDSYVYELWKRIQSNPKLKNKTALLVTNDHGRHIDGRKDGFVSHGDKCEGCKHISLLAMGPDFKKNSVVSKGGELIDISKTIAYIMGFEMPTSNGKVLNELFETKP